MSLDIIGPANAPNSVTARPADDRSFGTSDTWFKDCSSPTASDGTKLKSAFMNAVAGTFRALVRGNGNTALAVPIVTEDNADDAMALKAVQHMIQRGQPNYAVDSGTPGAVIVSPTPAPAELKPGMVLRVLIGSGNTNPGAATIKVGSFSTVPITQVGGGALTRGMLLGDAVVELTCKGTSFQVPAGTKSPGLPLPTRFTQTTPGSYTFTALITGWHRIFLNAAGGGGGGAAAGAAVVSGGAAGGGQVVDYVFLIAGVAYTYVVGSHGLGAGAGGTNGTNGGNTTFAGPAGTVVAQGGTGGTGSNSGGTGVGGGSGSGFSSSGYAIPGGAGYSASPQIAQGGQGGTGAGFGAAGGQASFGGGNAGTFPGGGGGGTVNAGTGGNGADGQFVIEW